MKLLIKHSLTVLIPIIPRLDIVVTTQLLKSSQKALYLV